MGITGLLPLLKAITRNVHISEYANQRVAVDAYCWLHRGAYSCSTELCQNIPTVKYINFCVARVQLLRSFNITPVLVFDGGALPSKRGQEDKRRKKRREERAKAAEYLQQGNRAAANDCYRKAVDITPRMANKLIKALQTEGIECIVAPYEADAQLAFLSHTGYVHSIISEDSDLLPFGCKRVLFKMDSDGNGKEIQLSDLGQNAPLRFNNFTQDMFRQMCILSGCDYLASITGLGVKKAHGLLSKYRTMDRVFRFLRNDRNYVVPPEYEEAFERAERTFLHQSVYDHINQRVIPLTPYPDGTDSSSFPFCGALLPDDIARLVASGQVDPYSYEPFDEEAAAQTAPVPAVSVAHDSDSGAHLGASSHEPWSADDDAMTMRASRSRTSLSSSGSAMRNVLGRMSSFGGGRNKLPLLLPQRNSISSYFTPSSRRTLRPFVPPRGSQSSQSSLEETPVEEEVVIELKSQEEVVELGPEDQTDEKESREAERERRLPPRPQSARAESRMHVETNETEKLLCEEETEEEEDRRDDGRSWEMVQKSTSSSSYEVLVARTPSPHSRFKVAPRPLLGEDSPSRRRLLFEDQLQVVVTSKYFSTTTTTTTTTTATSISAAAMTSPTTTMPTPTTQRHSPGCTAATPPSQPSSAFAWRDRPLLLDPTAQSVEESDEEEEAWTGEAMTTGEETGSGMQLAASHANTRATPPDRGKQQSLNDSLSSSSSLSHSSSSPDPPASSLPSPFFSRKRPREDDDEEDGGPDSRPRVPTAAAPLKRERRSSLMAKVDEFLRGDAFDDSQREDDQDDEKDRDAERKQERSPPKAEETIDLTFDELPDFESPMISRGKRLSTPLAFLSRNKQQQQQQRQKRQTPGTGTPAARSSGNSVGTLFSYFNKHGFNRQAASTSASRSPSPPLVTSAGGGDQPPKLEEDGIEIVGFVPRTPSSASEPSQQQGRGGASGVGITSPYFASSS